MTPPWSLFQSVRLHLYTAATVAALLLVCVACNSASYPTTTTPRSAEFWDHLPLLLFAVCIIAGLCTARRMLKAAWWFLALCAWLLMAQLVGFFY